MRLFVHFAWLVLTPSAFAQSMEAQAQSELQRFLRLTLSDCGAIQGVPVRTMVDAGGLKFLQLTNFKVGPLERLPLGDAAKASGIDWAAEARFDFTALRWLEFGVNPTWGEWYGVSKNPEKDVTPIWVVSSGPLGIVGSLINTRGTARKIQIFHRNNEWYVANSLRDQGAFIGQFKGAPNCKDVPPPSDEGARAWIAETHKKLEARGRADRCQQLLARNGCQDREVQGLRMYSEKIRPPGGFVVDTYDWANCRTTDGQWVLGLAFQKCSYDSVRFLASEMPLAESARQCKESDCMKLAGVRAPANSTAAREWRQLAAQLMGLPQQTPDLPSPEPTRPPAASRITTPQPPMRPLVLRPEVMQARLLRRTEPEYPPAARQARIQGTLRVHVTIGPDGNVIDAQPPRLGPGGLGMLSVAAAECVKKWQYQPYLVNGQPVAVMTTVPVTFSLH